MTKNVCKLIAFAVVILLAVIGTQTAFDNIHAVTDGVVYRSAQPSPRKLEKMISELSLKSILNLRGAAVGSKWYDNEINAARTLGVIHYDVDLSAKHYVSPDQLNEIVAIIHAAPKPILIHCNGGADRTGLVSAAWKLSGENASLEDATRQLSLRFGHFPYFIWSDSSAMDDSLKDYVHTKRPKVSHTTEDFFNNTPVNALISCCADTSAPHLNYMQSLPH